jgi:hypothetical protein
MTRVVIQGTTYALRNITSVSMAKSPSQKMGCVVYLLFIALFPVGLALLAIVMGSLGYFLFFGIPAAFLIGIALWWRSRMKPNYHVCLASATGESHALTSKDQDYIEKVVNSINEAIVRYR